MKNEIKINAAKRINDMDSLSIDIIKPNPNQPRKKFEGLEELAKSIKENGLLQPIIVRPVNEHYEIIIGERRWRAMKLIGLKEISAHIKNVTDKQAYEIAIIENIQRSDLAPLEEAEAFKNLQDHEYTQQRIGELIGKSQQFITSRLSLLKLPEQVKDMITTRVVNASIAQRLTAIPDEKEQIRLAKRCAKEGLTVKDLEHSIWKINQHSQINAEKKAIFDKLLENPALERYWEAITKEEIETRIVGSGIYGSMPLFNEHNIKSYKNSIGTGQFIVLSVKPTKNFTGQDFKWPKYSGAEFNAIDDYGSENLKTPLFTEKEWKEWQALNEKEVLGDLKFPGYEYFLFNTRDKSNNNPLETRTYDHRYGKAIIENKDHCGTCPTGNIFIKQGWGQWWIAEFNDGEGGRIKRRFFRHDHIGGTLIEQAMQTVDPFVFSHHNFSRLNFFKAQKVEMSWFYMRRKTIPKEEMIKAMETDIDNLKNQKELTEQELTERVLDFLQDYIPGAPGDMFREGECTYPRLPDGSIDKKLMDEIWK